MRRALLLLILACSACAAPASVEGVFSDEGFSLQCDAPLSKPTASGRDIIVVLSDYDTETLRTVNITLYDVANIPLGEPISVGTGARDDHRSSVNVVVGDLLIETRDDGVEIVSSVNPVRAQSTGGTLTLDARSADELAGSFRVDLDDGGFLEGVFTALPSS